jgi:DNA polymerase-1
MRRTRLVSAREGGAAGRDDGGYAAGVKTLYLIDGHAAFFRAYYAIRGRMTSPITREPTNAVFGFVAMLTKLMREQRPDYLAVVIDVGGDHATFRSELYPEYKMNRDPAPDDFHPQVERCLEILDAMQIPVIGIPGVEADDVIATIAREHAGEGGTAEDPIRIRIVSKDKDLMQILVDGVEMFDSSSGDVLDVDGLMEKHGIAPEQVIDMLALAGDTVDNVPGVKGIGPKTAAKLIAEWGSLDALLENIDQIKGKRRENIEAARDQLPLSRELVTLRTDVETGFELARARLEPEAIPFDAVETLCQELGLNRLRNELAELTGRSTAEAQEAVAEPPKPKRGDDAAGGLFAGLAGDDNDAAPPLHDEPTRGTYELVTTKRQLDALVKKLAKARVISIDTETTGLSTRDAKLCGICISTKAGSGVYIPVRSPSPDSHLDEATVVEALRSVLEDPKRPKVGQNLKYDLQILRGCGIRLRGIAFDTMIASYVLDASRPSHKLDHLALGLLGYHCIPITDLIGEKKRGQTQKTFEEVDLEVARDYAAEDADVTLRLMEHFEPQLKATKLRKLFDELEMPLVEVLAELEWNGIRVDRAELDHQAQALQTRIEDLKQRIEDAAPRPFNPDSPKQLRGILFHDPDHDDEPGLGLTPIKKTKTGFSTDVEVLEKLAADPDVETPVPALILEYRSLTKLVGTYLTALADAINEQTGRVHASFNQTVAATGRLSSSDPNLQNIPIRTEIGRAIRKAFQAEPGGMLVSADYSQIELRILAHLSEDPGLIEAFTSGADIHTAVAAQVFDVAPEDVTREQRGGAKMVNFGIVYGITPFGLARRLGTHPDGTPWGASEAAEIIDSYKARFSRIEAFLQDCILQAERQGYVETMMGRRRAIPEIAGRGRSRGLGERMAINSVVQGSAADLIKLAMIDLYGSLPDVCADARMLLQIHDELVIECPEAEADAVLEHMKARMEQAMELRVPLQVDGGWSHTWFEGH